MENRIIPFSFNPNPNKKKVYPTLFTLLAVGAALTVLSVTSEKFKGLISLAAVIFLGGAMYLFIRYVGQEYVYNVSYNASDEPMLVISKVIGKRISTMCAVPLYSIISIQKFTKSGEKYVPDKTVHRYNFIATFGPEYFFVIKSVSRTEKCEIALECTDEMKDRLILYAGIALEMKKRDDEEE